MILEKHQTQEITESKIAVIAIKGLYKSFGKNEVLKGVDLSIYKGENVVVLGRSGSGKSIVIKCIVGLVRADKGVINVLDTDITKLNTHEINKIRIQIGFLFQSAALYDSMSVRDNLMFILKRHTAKETPEVLEQQVITILESVGLGDAIDKMPSELSGGMRKRVGLARTLILKPEIVLYDEPTTGLDSITSREISELLLDIQKKNKTTSIIITHDMECAKLTGNRIVIMKEGVIYTEGSYAELEKSENPWVRSFFISSPVKT